MMYLIHSLTSFSIDKELKSFGNEQLWKGSQTELLENCFKISNSVDWMFFDSVFFFKILRL